MKKNFFELKIGTVISVVLCLVFAVLFWLFVKYSDAKSANAAATALLSSVGNLVG